MEAVTFIYRVIATDSRIVLLPSTGLGHSNKHHYGFFRLHYCTVEYACDSRTAMEKFPANAISHLFSVDGCYWLYWNFKKPVVLALMRDVNFFASLTLYGMCGLVWYYKGSLKEFLSELRK